MFCVRWLVTASSRHEPIADSASHMQLRAPTSARGRRPRRLRQPRRRRRGGRLRAALIQPVARAQHANAAYSDRPRQPSCGSVKPRLDQHRIGEQREQRREIRQREQPVRHGVRGSAARTTPAAAGSSSRAGSTAGRSWPPSSRRIASVGSSSPPGFHAASGMIGRQQRGSREQRDVQPAPAAAASAGAWSSRRRRSRAAARVWKNTRHVAHTAAAPPNHGRICLAMIGWTRNSRNATGRSCRRTAGSRRAGWPPRDWRAWTCGRHDGRGRRNGETRIIRKRRAAASGGAAALRGQRARALRRRQGARKFLRSVSATCPAARAARLSRHGPGVPSLSADPRRLSLPSRLLALRAGKRYLTDLRDSLRGALPRLQSADSRLGHEFEVARSYVSSGHCSAHPRASCRNCCPPAMPS